MKKFFKDKRILIISPEPWQHLFVSKHHYAIELSTNNKVYFLNPPSNEFSWFETGYKNIWEVNYKAFIPGMRYLPRYLQLLFFKRKYRAIEKMLSVKFDCIWSFDNSVFFDFSFLPSLVYKISHIVDYGQNFELPRAAKTANLCLGVSQNIVELLKQNNSNSFLVPHGIAISRNHRLEVALPGTHSIKAIFAGNLDRKHFDKSILLKLAMNNPNVDFIFLGSGGKNWERYDNTFYHGMVPSEVLHNYLNAADVLLLPYRVNEFPQELTNSHKVLEYLFSGKIVLSSFLSDYADKESLLMMVKESDFNEAFRKIVSNLSFYNSKENQNVRREFAERNSYSERLIQIEKLIEDSTL